MKITRNQLRRLLAEQYQTLNEAAAKNWDQYIAAGTTQESKAQRKQIQLRWESLGGNKELYPPGEVKSKASPGNFSNTYKGWTQWYLACIKDPAAMKLINRQASYPSGKNKGHIDPSEMLAVYSAMIPLKRIEMASAQIKSTADKKLVDDFMSDLNFGGAGMSSSAIADLGKTSGQKAFDIIMNLEPYEKSGETDLAAKDLSKYTSADDHQEPEAKVKGQTDPVARASTDIPVVGPDPDKDRSITVKPPKSRRPKRIFNKRIKNESAELTRNKIRRLIRESILKEAQQSTEPPGPFDTDPQNSSQQRQPMVGDELEAAATPGPGTYVAIVDSDKLYPEANGMKIESIIIDADNSVSYDEVGANSSEMADPAMTTELFKLINSNNRQDFNFTPERTQGTTTVAAKKKPAKKGASKIAQLQKIIGDKADGKWNRKTKGNTETDDKWKAWLEADNSMNFMAIMKLGLDKREKMPKVAFNSALERNSASDLAEIAGYGKNLTGVLAMAKAIDAMSPEEKSAAVMAVALSPEGETVMAAKNSNQEERITDAFVAETDDIINGTADAVSKIKNKKRRIQIVQKTVDLFKKKRQDAKSRGDKEEVVNLDRNFKIFTKKTKAEKLGIDMNRGGDPPEDMKESQERLSRGALYRRRYYGRY